MKTETTNKVIDDLKDCDINFDATNNDAPKAFVSFIKKGDKYEAVINVKDESGKPIVSDQKLIFKSTDGVGAELALRLFGKGGSIVYEPQSE